MAKEVKKPDAEVGVSPMALEKGAEAVTTTGNAEAVYAAREFSQNASRQFGAKATPDLVIAAFRMAGKENATLSEAKDIVEKFMNKEVK